MASPTPSLLLRLQTATLLGLLYLFISANARPCRTFVVSSYSFSFRHPSFPARHNPSLATLTTSTSTEIRSLIPVHIVSNENNYNRPSFPTEIFFDRTFPGHPVEEEDEIERRTSLIRAPFGFSSHDFSSLRDRTKDILSVVVALLFGVGCGALTAATMYLAWSLFSNRDYHASYDDYVDDDDIDSPKKAGYEKIPPAESVPAPAKEAV